VVTSVSTLALRESSHLLYRPIYFDWTCRAVPAVTLVDRSFSKHFVEGHSVPVKLKNPGAGGLDEGPVFLAEKVWVSRTPNDSVEALREV